MKNFNPDPAVAAAMMASIAASEIEFFYLLDLQLTTPYRITDRGIQIWYAGNKYTARDFLFADINHAAALSVDYMDIDIDDADGVITTLALSEDIRKKWGILYLAVMTGGQTAQTSGTLTIGKKYRIGTYHSDDNFINCGAASNQKGVEFTATATTPTHWAHLTQLFPVTGLVLETVELLRGMVGEWISEADNFRISFVNEFIYWKNCTKRTTSNTCPWTFNSPSVRAGGSGIGLECNYQGSQTSCDQSYERCVALGNNLGSGGAGGFGGFRFSIATAEKVVWWGQTPK
jgi:hypothetical protein